MAIVYVEEQYIKYNSGLFDSFLGAHSIDCQLSLQLSSYFVRSVGLAYTVCVDNSKINVNIGYRYYDTMDQHYTHNAIR